MIDISDVHEEWLVAKALTETRNRAPMIRHLRGGKASPELQALFADFLEGKRLKPKRKTCDPAPRWLIREVFRAYQQIIEETKDGDHAKAATLAAGYPIWPVETKGARTEAAKYLTAHHFALDVRKLNWLLRKSCGKQGENS